jgi:predicted flap endonuclease-1-like 5' DNA nuclease
MDPFHPETRLGRRLNPSMMHTALDILLFVLFAASAGFFIGQAWPQRFAFLARALPQGGGTGDDRPGSSQGRHYGMEVESEKWRRRAARLLATLRDRDRTLRARDRELEQLQDQISVLHRDRDPESCASICDQLRKLEEQLHAQDVHREEAERLHQCKEAELAALRQAFLQCNEKWGDVGTELSRCVEALAAMEHALAEQAPRAEAADDARADADATFELARLRAAASEQQKLNSELMQSLQDRRRRILVLETELAVMRGGAPSRSAAPSPGPARPQARPPSQLHDEVPLRTDDLTRIRGIGGKVAERLNRLGIYQFEQLAAFGEQDIIWLEQQDPVIRLRMRRDRWVQQAADLGPPRPGTVPVAASRVAPEARAVM